MSSNRPPRLEYAMRWTTIGLGTLCVVMLGYALVGYQEKNLEGRLLPAYMRGVTPWQTITEEEIIQGISIQPNTNTIIHIPTQVESIARKVLFGNKGVDVRYWGYCFPDNYSVALKTPNSGLPGRVFLSEAERAARREEERLRRRGSFSALRNLNEIALNELDLTRGRIRHQIEIFRGGQSCYVMTESPLPVGIDVDGDGVNSLVEKEWGSDSEVVDTDRDGLDDGTEIFGLGTDPKQRDSDGDGIIDGLEDANRNGRIDMGETDPMKIDSDRDGLCDGLCRVGRNGLELRGEDVNLNGQVDSGEPDPRKSDSDGDGILDEQEYFNCMLESQVDCKYPVFPLQ
ncbi:hypothetical protein COU80_01450 [Candidatus Peregrinibacteria bacterium CG10_big_fil_rev_8_21_14_0_10_55_24]|nr:MAG: hypothetical protein COU80_01450 [Candidatus Peregrinibacteria bacterium CG10_big_fil_rev_8_21_14_0_10_55_24]